ncbi:MAG: hypothetical protein IKI83_01415 [Prevotella sp.]|nr:hypothetical protein [Prevotella sp.]
MKKNISYIVMTVVIIALIVIAEPWESGRDLERITPNPPAPAGPFLPADDNVSSGLSPANIQIFMENSGSMDGYVNLNSEFKDALGKIIVKSDNYCHSINLYFVNEQIYDVQETALKGNVNNFVSQLNASNMKVGSTASSNINKIFSLVLDKTNKDTISILFSDFVYSIKGTDVSNQVANAKNATMGAFMNAIKKDPNFATIILQCSSQFQGKYYDRNDNPISYTGIRPYYIFIMGSYEQLRYIDKKLELNKTKTGIPGLMNKYLLSSKTWILNENTVQVLTSSYTNSQLIKPERNGYDIDYFKFDKNENSWWFAYALGINNLFVDSSYLTDKTNYEIVPNDIQLLKAEFTNDQAAINEVTQFVSPLVLQFRLNRSSQTSNLKVSILNKIPSWVAEANISDDLGTVPSPSQTFAISSLIEGVYEAFKSHISDKPIFEFEIKINKFK